MASRHLDRLVRDFISVTSSPYDKFNPFTDLQDPTFMSFKVDFFPDGGLSIPIDAFSTGGLFRRAPGNDGSSLDDYSFYDSAADYLARIGAPTRQAALQKFIKLLFDIQEKAPWYFQSVTGLSDIYKIEKTNNFRGKDKVLVFDCLESIDLRMSLLGDLYRSVAFDFKNWREVLPVNLRTFTMQIHVLEMRKFNTTYGIIADELSSPARPFKGEDKQKDIQDSQRRNVFGGATSTLFTGTFDNINQVANSVNSALGGLFTNLGSNAGPDPNSSLKSAFEAISVQTFILRDCEFDFFSEGPSYLENVTVKDPEEAAFKFKVTVGQIEKTGAYSFYDYVLSEWTKNTRTPDDISLESGKFSSPYFEETDKKSLERPSDASRFSTYSEYRKSIFPDFREQSEAYDESKRASDFLRKRPLENALGAIARNAVPQVNQAINQGLGQLTGGVIGTTPLGNVFDDRSFFQNAAAQLNNFLTPGNQLQTGTAPPPSSSPLGTNILSGDNPPTQNLSQNILQGANIISSNLPSGILSGPGAQEQNLSNDILTGANPDSNIGETNVFDGTPPLPKPDLGNDTNVFN